MEAPRQAAGQPARATRIWAETGQGLGALSRCFASVCDASHIPPPANHAIRPHKWHLCGWIERIPGGIRHNDDRGPEGAAGRGWEGAA